MGENTVGVVQQVGIRVRYAYDRVFDGRAANSEVQPAACLPAGLAVTTHTWLRLEACCRSTRRPASLWWTQRWTASMAQSSPMA